MKRVLILLILAVLMTAAFTGCAPGAEDALVSKTPFPEFSEADMEGNEISSDIFADYDATIVNFWNNGCGTCIAEMPELEELYQDFEERNINLIGVGTDSGESKEQLETAREILEQKGVTYVNLSPDPEGDFYKEFISDIFTYPTTYIVDSEGNIIGAPNCGKCKGSTGYCGRAIRPNFGGKRFLRGNTEEDTYRCPPLFHQKTRENERYKGIILNIVIK